MTTTRAEHTAIVCQSHRMTPDDLRSWNKSQRYVAARRELWHRLLIVSWAEQLMAGVSLASVKVPSLTMVGRWFRKDHTTCLYAVRRYSTEFYGTCPKASLADMRAAYYASQVQSVAA